MYNKCCLLWYLPWYLLYSLGEAWLMPLQGELLRLVMAIAVITSVMTQYHESLMQNTEHCHHDEAWSIRKVQPVTFMLSSIFFLVECSVCSGKTWNSCCKSHSASSCSLEIFLHSGHDIRNLVLWRSLQGNSVLMGELCFPCWNPLPFDRDVWLWCNCCEGGKNVSLCLGVVLKNINTSGE